MGYMHNFLVETEDSPKTTNDYEQKVDGLSDNATEKLIGLTMREASNLIKESKKPGGEKLFYEGTPVIGITVVNKGFDMLYHKGILDVALDKDERIEKICK